MGTPRIQLQTRLLAIMMEHMDVDKMSEKGAAFSDMMEERLGGPSVQNPPEFRGLGPADLGIDSAAMMEIMAGIEREFGVTLDPEEAVKWRNLADMVASLER